MASNAGTVGLAPNEVSTMLLKMAFQAGTNIAVAALVHFHLVFPRPSLIYLKHKWLPWVFYFIGILFTILQSVLRIASINYPSDKIRAIDLSTAT